MMERRFGRIINVTRRPACKARSARSITARQGRDHRAHDVGGEGLAKHGITANAVAPGAATPMTETIRTDERFRERYLDRIPMGRWAEPEEIAPVFVFFASDAASYVTGQVLAADGGMTIR